MKKLLIAALACLISTSAMAEIFNLGIPTVFNIDLADSCYVKDAVIECRAVQEEGDLVAIFVFEGIVAVGPGHTQVNQYNYSKNPADKQKSTSAMEKRLRQFLKDEGMEIDPKWGKLYLEIDVWGDFYATQGAVGTTDGLVVVKHQIWLDGNAYELTVLFVNTESNIALLHQALNTLRLAE